MYVYEFNVLCISKNVCVVPRPLTPYNANCINIYFQSYCCARRLRSAGVVNRMKYVFEGGAETKNQVMKSSLFQVHDQDPGSALGFRSAPEFSGFLSAPQPPPGLMVV